MTTRLSGDCAGSGEPLLLLHGIGTTRDDFSALHPALEADYDVLALDLSGHGDSPPLSNRPSIHAVTDTIEADLDTSTARTGLRSLWIYRGSSSLHQTRLPS